MLLPRATARDGDHRRHARSGGRRTQKICRLMNAPRQVRVFSISPRARSIASTTYTGGGERVLYSCAWTCPSCSTTHPPLTRQALHALAHARPSRSDAIAAATRAPYAAHALVLR